MPKAGALFSPTVCLLWKIIMLSHSCSSPAVTRPQRSPDACVERFLLPQPAMLTTVDPQSGQREGLSLPNPVHVAIAERGASALRAWRNYCGLSMQSLRYRTNAYMSTATLDAFDSGNAMFCEWTVGVLADALSVASWQLLMAQAVWLEHRDRAAPPSMEWLELGGVSAFRDTRNSVFLPGG